MNERHTITNEEKTEKTTIENKHKNGETSFHKISILKSKSRMN